MPIKHTDIDAMLADATPAELFALIHERKRKLQHQAVKAAQPTATDILTLRIEAWQPLTTEEQAHTGLDYLCQTVQDCLIAGDFADAHYALIRVWRKVWAMQPGLGSINPVKK